MATLDSIAPFFVVDDLQTSLDFYRTRLGFEITYRGGGNGVSADDFWGIVQRDGVMIMLKAISPGIHPQPNHTRHEWAPWDAYVYTPDPDALYAEYLANAAPVHKPLTDTSDGLRAFEILDNSGYVICFGRPQSS
jgi:catechol 2,3-dioxygenase-like lactoylglutathione lyase family enzyme